MNRLLPWILAALVAGVAMAIAGTSTIDTKDAAGNIKTYAVRTDGSGNFIAQVVLCDQSAAATCATVGSAGLQVVLSAGTQTIGALSANQSVNLNQLAGTGTDTNSGVKSAGTLRVVLATDQPQLTNALKVDGSAVTQPVSGTVAISGTATVSGTVTANAGSNLNTSALALESGGNLATLAGAVTSAKVQANVAQMNGVAVTMGDGVTGTGVQRVTIASDSSGQVRLAAGTATIGALVANQSTNIAQMNGVAVTMGDGVTGTGVQRVTIASDSTGQIRAAPLAASTGGASPARLISAASTNATVMKAAAGTLYVAAGVNTTSTLYYLKFYDKATTPTCNTDTVVWGPWPVPQATGAGAGFVVPLPVGLAFNSGISYCLTGGSADNDNTNAATGVFLNFSYK